MISIRRTRRSNNFYHKFNDALMYLITPREVLEYAFSELEDVSSLALKPTKILIAQERFVRPVFGDRMYDALLEDSRYRSFVESYLKPALAHYVRHSIVDELAIRIGNKGVGLYHLEDSSKNHEDIKTNNITKEGKVRESGSQDKSGLKESTDKRNSETENKITVTSDSTESLLRDVSGRQASNEIVTTSFDKDKESVHSETIQDQKTGDKRSSDRREGNSQEVRTGSSTYSDTVSNDGTKTSEGFESTHLKDSGTTQTTRSGLKSASDRQCRMLAQRALSDARVLMRRAVEYVEAHPERFPDYEPLREEFRQRHYVGGLVL